MMYVEAFMALELITSFQVVQHVCVGVWVCGCEYVYGYATTERVRQIKEKC